MYPVQQSASLAVAFFAFDSNGDGVTGKVDGDWTKRISKAGGAFAGMTVTISEMENGWYSFTLSTSHTDTLGILSLSFIATGVKRVNMQYRVSVRTLDDLAFPTVAGRSLDVTATGAAGIDWGNIENPTTAQNLSATNIDVDQVVASVSGAVGSVGTNGITAASLAADAVDEIWDEQVDGTVTARESLRLANSANGGKLSGAATTTVLIRDLADTKNRVNATVDSSGNRTAVTRDLT